MRCARSIFLLVLLTLPAFAGEDGGGGDETMEVTPPSSIAGPAFDDVFDFSQAIKPRPGDWLEYHIAFPVDPLENSLSPNPAPTPGVAAAPAAPPPASGEADDSLPPAVQPAFDLAPAWRTVPLRLEIREVDDSGCNAELTFGGETVSLRLPASGDAAEGSFHYGDGAETERQTRIGGATYTVREIRRTGSGYGFVRWFSREIPFGTVRFATEDADLRLVGFGRGVPPDFPLRPADEASPAPGILY